MSGVLCPNCGVDAGYSLVRPINKRLQEDWELSDAIANLFNVREGTICNSCGVNRRAQDLATAILKSKYGYGAESLKDWVKIVNKKNLAVCELNACHELHKTLKHITHLTYAEYGTDTEENIENLSYANDSFDIVLHSETLEHVNNPKMAMEECRRVIKKGGLVLFTTPVLWSRKTRKRARTTAQGTEYLLRKSYHGQDTEDYLVRYEFGYDIDTILGSTVALNNWREHNYVFKSGKKAMKLTKTQKKQLADQEKKSGQMIGDATLDNDYERMVPEFHKGTITYAEHITRYQAAQSLVEGKIVLDIASGSGYGTKLLAETARQLYGVDVNERAVSYAKKNYGAENISYLLGNGEKIPLKDESVDVVATFETIEHIEDYRQFMHEMKRVLRPDGLAIVSTPNELEFAEGNHFHLHEFEHDELMALLKEHFAYVKPYYQATWKYVALADEAVMANEGMLPMPTMNVAPLQKTKYLYFYFLCSDRKITETIEPIAAVGEHYSDRYMTKLYSDADKAQKKIRELEARVQHLSKEIENIRSSRTYKMVRKAARVRGALRQQNK